MKRKFFGSVLVACFVVISGYSSPILLAEVEEAPFIALELWTPKLEYKSNEQLLVGVTFTNQGSQVFSGLIPFEWEKHGNMRDYFKVYVNGKETYSSLAKAKPKPFKFKTQLLPGESVSIVFDLSTIYKIPGDAKSRAGRYTIKSKGGVVGSAIKCVGLRSLSFWVSENPAPVTLGSGMNKYTGDKTSEIIQSKTLSGDDKFGLLKKAAAEGDKKKLWDLLKKSDNVYAIVKILQEIDKNMIDKDELFKLLSYKDLAIRRAAIQTMAKLGKDEKLAKKLKEFIATQKDEPILEYSKNTLRILLGEEPEKEEVLNRDI